MFAGSGPMAGFLIPYSYLIDLLLFKYFIQGLSKHAGQRGKHCPVFVLTNPGLYLGTGSQAAKTFPRDKAHAKSSGKRDSLLVPSYHQISLPLMPISAMHLLARFASGRALRCGALSRTRRAVGPHAARLGRATSLGREVWTSIPVIPPAAPS